VGDDVLVAIQPLTQGIHNWTTARLDPLDDDTYRSSSFTGNDQESQALSVFSSASRCRKTRCNEWTKCGVIEPGVMRSDDAGW
jgi:hypothetical protein